MIDDSEKTAYSYALNLLSRRDYSKVKLSQKLLNKGFESSLVDKIINHIVSSGIYQEQNYISAKIRSLIRKNFSIRAIGQQLENENIHLSSSEIVTVFEELGISSSDQIKSIIEKKVRIKKMNLAKLSPKEKNKIIAALVTKGHSFGEFLNDLQKGSQKILE